MPEVSAVIELLELIDKKVTKLRLTSPLETNSFSKVASLEQRLRQDIDAINFLVTILETIADNVDGDTDHDVSVQESAGLPYPVQASIMPTSLLIFILSLLVLVALLCLTSI